MDIPLQIAFRKVERSDWAEEQIRKRTEKLQRYYSAMTAARVTVDQRSDNAEGTLPPVVRIEVSVPGAPSVVVAHEPDRLQRRYQSPDLSNAISEAFDLAERQLLELKERRSGRPDGQTLEASHQLVGQIADLRPEEDHGFLLTATGSLLYFHRNAVVDGDISDLRRGDTVRYVEAMGDTGPTARTVRLHSGAGSAA